MIFKLFLLSTLVGLASSACFDNGDKEIGGSCYKFVAQKLSFEDARNWCHYKNPVTASYLAYVPNQFTSNFLASYARSAFGTNDGSFWIGLSRKSGGSWSWDAGFPIGYTNFGDQVGQNYVAESIVNAKWNTFGASDTNFFVCGYDPAAPPTFAPQTAGPSGPTPTMRATTQPVPTTTVEPDSCTPLDNTTFLFAYSNDFEPDVIKQAVILYSSQHISLHYTTFASIRFDTANEGEFDYQNSFGEISSYVQNHLPDPALGFESQDTGSDVLRMIDRFLDNNVVPVCGSKMIIYVKRYPNETDYSRIVAKMRQHHSYLTIFASTNPSGGYHPEILYDLASKTNGICAFDDDANIIYAEGIVETVYNPFLVYAANPQVSGNGRIQLTSLSVQYEASYWFTMTIQDNGPMTVVQAVTLSWINNYNDGQLYINGTSSNGYYIDNHIGNWEPLNADSYNVQLDYNYTDSKERRVQIRVHGYKSEHPIDYWVPYDN